MNLTVNYMLLCGSCTFDGIGWELHKHSAAFQLRICLCCFPVVLHLKWKEIFNQEFPLSKQEETADRSIFLNHLIKMSVAAETEESLKKCVWDWYDCSLQAGIQVCFHNARKLRIDLRDFKALSVILNDWKMFCRMCYSRSSISSRSSQGWMLFWVSSFWSGGKIILQCGNW